MAKRKSKPQKLDVSNLETLAHNPFSVLLGAQRSESEAEVAKEPQTEHEHPRAISLYVRAERRKHGKWVTCIRHYQSDPKPFLAAMRKAMACGGGIEGDVILLQGDCVDRIKMWLSKQGFRVR
ncbi:MAG: translation initiation factor [Acidobacteria bacterium]|nr:translation initiation factor [Acidobacteriota bacterium]